MSSVVHCFISKCISFIRLKKEKECYRQELEDLAHRQLEPAKDESRENAEEVTLRERLEALQMMEMADKKQRNEQKKAREMKR